MPRAKKSSRRRASVTTNNGDPAEALSTLLLVNAALASGAAEAISEGYDALNKALEIGDVTKPGFDNPLLVGSLTGSLKALNVSLESLRAAVNILFPE